MSAATRRTVRIVYPFLPGGPGDAYARLLADHCTRTLGGTFVVENRTGASGTIGTAYVANSPPDGGTFIMPSNSSQVIAPLVLRDVGFDPVRSLAPVVGLFRYGMYLLVSPRLPVRTVAEFVDWARAQRRGVNLSSVGAGSGGHLLGELFRIRAGFPIEHLPYRGAPAALLALSTGEADYCFDSVGSAQPLVAEGRLRGLAVTGAARSPTVPDVPTLAESGFPGFEQQIWFGLLGPAATPAPIIARLNGAANAFLADPAFRARMAANAHEPLGGTPGDFADLIGTEMRQWAEIVRTTDVHVD